MERSQAVAPTPKRNSHRLARALQAPATAVLAVLLLILTPAAAEAAFRVATASTVSVGTYKIPAPATATWSFKNCVRSKYFRSDTLTLANYAKVPRADSYLVTITAPDGTTSTRSITGNTLTLTQTSSSTGTYTFTIQAVVGTWIGAPYTGSDTC